MAGIRINETELSSAFFEQLAPQQVARIHWTSLEILERVGARVHLPAAVQLLQAAGAEVSEGNLVRIPAGMVEKAFSTVPKRVVLCDRNGRTVMPLQGGRSFFGPGSDCAHLIDHRSGRRRLARLADVAAGARLCDALPNIDFCMSMVLPSDVDATTADVQQMAVMLANTTKPIINVSYGFDGTVAAVEMAEAVVGGADALRRRPLMAGYVSVTSGTIHNAESLQKLIFLAERNLPVIYVPGSMAGATSPVTLAGAVALDNAGVLLGLVLSQLVRPGAPFIMAGYEGPVDLRTMVQTFAAPERGLFQALARHYQLPAFAIGGASEAKLAGPQAAAEAALNLLAAALGGGNIVHDLGYLDSANTFSFVQLALCNEIVGWIEAFLQGVRVDDETLALDTIVAAGVNGNYLASAHTRRHYRQQWYPRLFERDSYTNWQNSGSRTLAERAAEQVETLLSEHHPDPLPQAVRLQLDRIVARSG